jgi:hypothetical protein
MGKWNKHAPRARRKFSRESFVSDSARRYAQFRQASDILRREGFRVYVNQENHCLAVPCFDCMFEFRQVTPVKARKFVAWVNSTEVGGSFPFPLGIDRIRLSRGKGRPPLLKSRVIDSGATSGVSPYRSAGRSNYSGGGFWSSTIPGHYAELNWFDLRAG